MVYKVQLSKSKVWGEEKTPVEDDFSNHHIVIRKALLLSYKMVEVSTLSQKKQDSGWTER